MQLEMPNLAAVRPSHERPAHQAESPDPHHIPCCTMRLLYLLSMPQQNAPERPPVLCNGNAAAESALQICAALAFTSGNSWMHVSMQIIAWIGAAALSLLIIASRKHYSVDVVIAWYVVPLVFWSMHRRWTTKRPAVEPWPHRPLIEHTRVGGSAANMAGGVEVGSTAELAEVIVTAGSGPETSKVLISFFSCSNKPRQNLLPPPPAPPTPHTHIHTHTSYSTEAGALDLIAHALYSRHTLLPAI